MFLKASARFTAAGALAVGLWTSGFVSAQQPPRPAEEPVSELVFRQGKPLPEDDSMIMNLNTIEQFSVAPFKLAQNPRSNREEIAEVRLVQPPAGKLPDAFVVTTKDLIGTTEIILPLVKEGDPRPFERRIELLVIDQMSRAIQDYLKKQIKTIVPTSVVELVVANRSTAVVNGYVERAEHVQPIIDLVRGTLAQGIGAAPDAVTVVNALRVTGATQVQLKVVIAEVQRQKIRDLGFDWNWLNVSPNAWLAGASTATGLNPAGGGALGLPLPLVGGSTNIGQSNINFLLRDDGVNNFQAFLRALERNDLGKLLAEPVLTTTTGQPAYFNVGGQTPILLPQGNGTISIQYRDFGTNLRFVPTVLGEGRIRLEVRPEVSEVNQALSVVVNGISVPGFITRFAETTVEMETGQSLVIAGLIQKRVRAIRNKIPVLGDIPIAGAAFQNKNYEQTDTDLVILVTPHLVDALDHPPCELPGRESRIPNNVEYYLGSKFEPPCFGDPYRDHWKNHKAGIPSPTPMPVRPFDNYGQPVETTTLGGPVSIPPEGKAPADPAAGSPTAALAAPTRGSGPMDVLGLPPAAVEGEVSLVPPPPPVLPQATLAPARPAGSTGGWTRAEKTVR
jgi:Flp pilus assembly secretin CpaC